MMEATGFEVVFFVVNVGNVPVPEEDKPIVASELVQVYTVPGMDPVKASGWLNTCPVQSVMSFITVTEGVGFTVTTTVKGIPVHPPDLGVTV